MSDTVFRASRRRPMIYLTRVTFSPGNHAKALWMNEAYENCCGSPESFQGLQTVAKISLFR